MAFTGGFPNGVSSSPLLFFESFLSYLQALESSYRNALHRWALKMEGRTQIDMTYRYSFHRLAIHPLYNLIELCTFCSALELRSLQGTAENLTLKDY